MLVLSSKAKPRIVISEHIELVVVAVSGDRVKLGINASSDAPIHRKGVHRRIHSENGGDFATVPTLAEAEMVLANLMQGKGS